MTLWLALWLVAVPYHTVEVNGSVDDYAADELVLQDPSDDSFYGPSNELYDLYLTWDQSGLYLALEYVVQNNGVVIAIGTGEGGVRDMNGLDWYPRNFQFAGVRINYLVALWNADLSTGGVRRILDSHNTEQVGNALISNSGYAGTRSTVEVLLPWSELYPHGFPAGATIDLVAMVVGGDHATGGDLMPNPTGATFGFGNAYTVRTFYRVHLDTDGNAVPDSGTPVTALDTVWTVPTQPLRFTRLELLHRVVRPGTELGLTVEVSDAADLRVTVYNERGQRMMAQSYPGLEGHRAYTWTWPVPDWPAGIYILQVMANKVVQEKRSFVVLK